MTAADLLGPSPDGLGTYYRLPFSPDDDWNLGNGNWDDPVHGHDTADGKAQSYSYDFGAPEGTEVRAARGGQVIAVESDHWRTSWAGFASPEVLVSQDYSKVYGNGNIVVVRHLDQTVAAYNHLQPDRVFVRVGDYVPRGAVLALSGCVGNVTGPHLHFDVHPTFTSTHSWDNTTKIWFQDTGHDSWRPLVGEPMKSNNVVTPDRFYGLFDNGAGTSSMVAGMSADELTAAAEAMRTSPYPIGLTSIEVTDADDVAPEFAGVFTAGADTTLRTGLTPAAFEELVTTGAAADGRHVADFAAYRIDGKLTYAAVLAPGVVEQEFVPDLVTKDFAALVDSVGKAPDPRHVQTFELRVTRAGRKYSALLAPGHVDQVLATNLNRTAFFTSWQGQAKSGRDITAFAEFSVVEDDLFTVLYGPVGAGGQQLLGPVPYDVLAHRAADAPKFGARLVGIRRKGIFLESVSG
ncbi:M23 family metallopeptidase [Marmoricola sp. RAF53]|uniref:M23 family metallopeptidase n=1 Tax=Marmoricola sp. RAF53 TaxID=3233059 RepID=UPI003F964639